MDALGRSAQSLLSVSENFVSKRHHETCFTKVFTNEIICSLSHTLMPVNEYFQNNVGVQDKIHYTKLVLSDSLCHSITLIFCLIILIQTVLQDIAKSPDWSAGSTLNKATSSQEIRDIAIPQTCTSSSVTRRDEHSNTDSSSICEEKSNIGRSQLPGRTLNRCEKVSSKVEAVCESRDHSQSQELNETKGTDSEELNLAGNGSPNEQDQVKEETYKSDCSSDSMDTKHQELVEAGTIGMGIYDKNSFEKKLPIESGASDVQATCTFIKRETCDKGWGSSHTSEDLRCVELSVNRSSHEKHPSYEASSNEPSGNDCPLREIKQENVQGDQLVVSPHSLNNPDNCIVNKINSVETDIGHDEHIPQGEYSEAEYGKDWLLVRKVKKETCGD